MLQGGSSPKLIGIGTGTTAAAVTDTDLQTESSETLNGNRVSGTEARVTITNSNDAWQCQGTVTATGTRAVTEAACFDAQSVGATVPNAHGNMIMRATFAAINMNSGDSLALTFQLKFVSGVT
jgi:hypothetical protein